MRSRLFCPGRRHRTRAGAAMRGVFAILLAGIALAGASILPGAGPQPAHAQFWGGWGWGNRPFFREEPPRPRRPIQRREESRPFSFPFFGGGPTYHPRESYPRHRTPRYSAPDDRWPSHEPRRRARQADGGGGGGRAPAHKKPEVEASKTAVVFGDSMADWLAYGLEEALAESGEVGVARKSRAGGAGLIHNEPREFDWVQHVRDTLAAEKADFVVMMIGLADRRPIRERVSAPSEPQPNATGPQRERPQSVVTHEFRSDKWVELYGKRVDEAIAALKAKGVPVIWVGMPPIRGPKSRADLTFLNEIFQARAEKAGIAYVDVWEGFLNEEGEYSQYGPDVLGQVRQLRSADGVHFTRAGARKLAHFVDREIKRLLSRETPVALPAPEEPQPAAPGEPAPRPTVGPVIVLTGGPPPAEHLLGARPEDAGRPDPIAERVLVKGEPPPPQAGRADNFVWPRADEVAHRKDGAAPVAASAPAPSPSQTQAASATAPQVQ